MSEEILINAAVQDMLEKSAAGQQYPSDTAVSNYINNLAANRDYIEGVVLSGTDHTLFSTERIFTEYSSLESIRKEQWFREMTEEDTCVWNQTAGRILLARPVYSMKDYRTLLGYVVIYLNNDYLQKIWNSCVWGDTTNICIFDEKGAVIVSAYKTADYTEQMKQLFSKGYVSEYDSRIDFPSPVLTSGLYCGKKDMKGARLNHGSEISIHCQRRWCFYTADAIFCFPNEGAET